MKTKEFDYEIPRHLIAQEPIEPRDHSRLLVLDARSGGIKHKHFYDLLDYLKKGDVLVLNDSRVIKSRLRYTRGLGDEVVILLLRQLSDKVWEFLLEFGTLDVNEHLVFSPYSPYLEGLIVELGVIVGKKGERVGVINFSSDNFLDNLGETPIPPYIHGYKGSPERYQTVYSLVKGSSAAPTAGLHFTPELLRSIEDTGVKLCFTTLHVSIDTFMPIIEDNIEDHIIHKEFVSISKEYCEILNNRKGRIICVGTTTVRVLEQIKGKFGEFKPWEGWADVYITPGHKFCMEGLITNFHYPRSTNIVMVSSFASWDLLMRAYGEAFNMRYRLYSFGDAMLILK